MSGSVFNPSEAVTFDLAYGHVHLDGAPTRVMVPAEALVALCKAAGEEEQASMGHAIGEAMGRRVGVRLAGGGGDRHAAVRKSKLEDVICQLAGELAITGMGALSAERWGKALVIIMDQSPLGADGDGLLADILQAAMAALIGKQVRVLCLNRDGVRARFITVSGAAVQAVRARIAGGEDWGSILSSMQKGSPAA
jgi:hypothetical protein